MRLLLIATLAVAAALATAAPAVDAVPRHPVCGPSKARTIATSDQARVFARHLGHDEYGPPYACARRHDKQRKLAALYERECLGSSSGCGGLGKVRVAGRFIAYEDYTCCGANTTDAFTIRILDSRTMRLRARVRSRGTTSRLLLRTDGAAAWSYASLDDIDRTLRGHVRRYPSCGGKALLASGSGVQPESLRLVPGGIAWQADGAERADRLCTPGRR